MSKSVTQGPWSFDGHGINAADGTRICKVSCCEPYIYETGTPIRNTEFDATSNLIAASGDLFSSLCEMVGYMERTDENHKESPIYQNAKRALDKAMGRDWIYNK